MHRMVTWTACLVVLLFAGIVQAQAQLSIRAASAEPVERWQRMQVEHSTRVVWVAPTEVVTGSDIERAQPEVNSQGLTRIVVVFTEAGARKIRDLTIAQSKKLIALVVDGRVIWAPMVLAEAGKESVLTGNGPNGLTQEEVERIMAIVR